MEETALEKPTAAQDLTRNASGIPRPDSAVRVITRDELRTLFDRFRNNACGAALELVFASGARLDLLLRLRVKDIDWEKRVLRLPDSEDSSIRFPDALEPVLAGMSSGKAPMDFVFSAQTPATRPLSLRTVQKFLARTVRDLGFAKISVQSLRDNFAVYSLRLGGDPGLLMSQMGYRHRRSFRRILSAVPPDQRKFPSPIDRLRLS